MQPHTHHYVLTPQPSVMVGGHFYRYDTMFESAVGILDECLYGCLATNAHHECMWEMLRRMVKFLEKTSKTDWDQKVFSVFTRCCRWWLKSHLYSLDPMQPENFHPLIWLLAIVDLGDCFAMEAQVPKEVRRDHWAVLPLNNKKWEVVKKDAGLLIKAVNDKINETNPSGKTVDLGRVVNRLVLHLAVEFKARNNVLDGLPNDPVNVEQRSVTDTAKMLHRTNVLENLGRRSLGSQFSADPVSPVGWEPVWLKGKSREQVLEECLAWEA
jgi:hypothetical protein